MRLYENHQEVGFSISSDPIRFYERFVTSMGGGEHDRFQPTFEKPAHRAVTLFH